MDFARGVVDPQEAGLGLEDHPDDDVGGNAGRATVGDGAARAAGALERLAAGRMVVLVDDTGPQNRGDLLAAAEHASADTINVMARHARGLVRLALPAARCDALALHPMPVQHRAGSAEPFTVSIEARDGVATGISAADRARTIAAAIDPASTPEDLVRPGHVFPLRASAAGVLAREGVAEAAVDLARLAGLCEASVLCHILGEDGAVATGDDLAAFAESHGLATVSISDVVTHRRMHVERVVSTTLPTTFGDFTAVGYRSFAAHGEHVALVRGDVAGGGTVPVAVLSGCVAGHVFRSRRCDCAARLQRTMDAIDREGRGVVLYLGSDRHALDCAPTSGDDEVATQILADLGVASAA